jgi:hypothetical protein
LAIGLGAKQQGTDFTFYVHRLTLGFV